MNDEQMHTLAQLQAFLDGTTAVNFAAAAEERYDFIARTIRRFGYTPSGSRDWQTNSYRKEGDKLIPYTPSGSRDWKSNEIRVEGNNLVPYTSSGSRDWKANSYRREGDRWIPYTPSGSRDWKAQEIRGED